VVVGAVNYDGTVTINHWVTAEVASS
jgi:hypothetical protein